MGTRNNSKVEHLSLWEKIMYDVELENRIYIFDKNSKNADGT
jgi:hypothetical protein